MFNQSMMQLLTTCYGLTISAVVFWNLDFTGVQPVNDAPTYNVEDAIFEMGMVQLVLNQSC